MNIPNGRGFLLTRPLRDVTGIPLWHPASVQFLLTRPLRDVTLAEIKV